MRKRLLLFTLLFSLVSFMAACGGSAPEPAAPAEEPAAEAPAEEAAPTEEAMAEEPAAEEAAAEEAAAPAEEDPLGTIVVAAGDPIRLASALVIAGPNETLG
ncbi:MAG: hypothetical protein KDI79_22900, partial [Anaerolineae bacterium]|nr:hypothetical protein [Anaerolineae bacterium]